jgi:hypothetical protein
MTDSQQLDITDLVGMDARRLERTEMWYCETTAGDAQIAEYELSRPAMEQKVHVCPQCMANVLAIESDPQPS